MFFINSIKSVIYGIYIAPLQVQGNYSEALPTQARAKRNWVDM